MLLVTGATGHIGNVLVQQLVEQGEQVRALVLPSDDTTPLAGLDVEIYYGDILQPETLPDAMKNIIGVFHLAGYITIMPGKNQRAWDVNVQGTKNVLAAAQAAEVKRLVYTSSIHALKRVEHGIEIDESVPYDIDNPYGAYDRSKATATVFVGSQAGQGMEVIITCPTGVIGPYDYQGSLMGEIIRMAADGKVMVHFGGAYDFVDVRDVAAGLIAAYQQGRDGESYLLSGDYITISEIVALTNQITGKKMTEIKIPLALAHLAARIMPSFYRLTNSKPQLTPYSVEVLLSNAHISHAKASNELGYQARPLADSITDGIAWYRAQKN